MPTINNGGYTPSPIVSPGVFTKENDLSGLAQGVAEIGAVIVAPFPKGPGFTPVIVESVADLESQFGVADGVYYGPYTAKEYLIEKGFVTVCRVGALTGYEQQFPFVIYAIKGEWTRAIDAGYTNFDKTWLLNPVFVLNSWNTDNTAAQLITNGTFTTDTSGWDHSGNGGFNVVDSYLVITGSGLVTQSFATALDKSYDLYYSFMSGSDTHGGNIKIGTTAGASDIDDIRESGVGPNIWANRTASFVAQGSTTYIALTNAIVGTTLSASFDNISVQEKNLTNTYVTGAVVFSSSFTVQFADVAGSASAQAAGHGTGSSMYYGQNVYIGNVAVKLPISQALAWRDISVNVASSSILNELLQSGSIVGNLVTTNNSITGIGEPWNNPFDPNTTGPGTQFASSSYISQSFGECEGAVYKLDALIKGRFGKYTGEFQSNGTPTYNPCDGTWKTNNADYKVLAVLADTQNSPVNSNLIAAGFNGSTMVTASNIAGATEIPIDYNLTLKSTDSTAPYGTYAFSFDAGSTKYITTVFGDDPTAGNIATYAAGTKREAAYTYKIFENTIRTVTADPLRWYISGSVLPDDTFKGQPMNFTDEFSLKLNEGDCQFGLTNAATPWVISQEISPWNGGTPTRFVLFRVLTMSDGTDTNRSYKIEISNIKLAGTVSGTDWGTFTLSVRDYSDTDKKPQILQQFNNLTLDPDSSNFVARRIGDRFNFIDFNGKILEYGTYTNNSKYIRIEMNDIPWPITAVPYGFEAYALPVDSSAGYWCPPMRYTKASVYSVSPGKYPSGINFDGAPTGAENSLAALYPTSSTGVGTAEDNKQYFAPLPQFDGKGGTYSSVGQNSNFALDMDITNGGVIEAPINSGSLLDGTNIIPAILDRAVESTYVKMRKFIFGFQGGFDGQSPAIPINVGGNIIPGNTQGLDCTNINSAGSIAYKQCIAALGNADEFDINMIVTPGVLYDSHPYVTTLVVDMCEARGDCFYILDLYADDGNPSGGQIESVINLAAEFDTNYAGAYYPWVKIKDTNTNKIITVPPSVLLPGVYAANDKVAGEWWAVAGLNRGGIPKAIQVTDRTTHAERDDLYEGKVNPIAAFPGQGIVVWGQKTLQVKASALDRINVRRLLIEIKKFFASSARYLVFEQNTAATRNRFLSIVNPYLQSIQQRSGLYAFQVVMDDTNNTPDLIDQNVLYGQIYLKPVKSAEFIIFDFNILSTGASFGASA